MIRMNVSKETLESGAGLEDVVKKIIWYQIFWKDAIGKDIRLMAFQKALYESKGNSPSIMKLLKNMGVEHNLIKPLCDTATNTFLGRVPDIVSNGTEAERNRIQKFSLTQKHNDFEEEIYDVALNMSITGSGFLCLYNDEGDTFPHYRSLDPLYTNVVYDCSVAMKRLFAYHIYFENNPNGGNYICLIYTKTKMFAYKTGNISIPSKMAYDVYPLNLFMVYGVGETNVAEHGYSDIPIVEFINNKQQISDCKPALNQIALYTALQNNRFQNVADIMNYLLFIKNARLGDEKEAEKSLNLIKNHRVIALEGEDVDARFLSNPLNQADIQHLADDFKNEIHYITGIPDFTSKEFTQNASDPILKSKTKPLLDLCATKEKWFNKGYMAVLKLTLDFVKDNDESLYNKIKFDLENIDLVYTHSLPSNDGDMVRNIVNLANVGQLAPRISLQGLSFVPNVDAYLKEVKEYNAYIDTRKALKENKNENNGLNATNLERQNREPKDKNQEDNSKNFVQGASQDLSPNKVE